MTDLDDLTPARRIALHTIGRAEQRGIRARYSNTTTEPDAENPSAYHQAADSLVDLGLAMVVNGPSGKVLELTSAGWELFTELVGGEPADLDNITTPEPDASDEEEGDEPAADDDSTLVVSAAPLPEFEGLQPVAVVSKLNGAGQRIRRPMHLGERVLLLVEAEVAAVGHGRTDEGVKRLHTLKVEDLWEIGGRVGRRFANEVKQAWAAANDVDPLPMKVAGDRALTEALGLGDTGDPVVAVFANAARAVWPDDFPKGAGRPKVGDRLAVPGDAGDDELVVELVDCTSGRVLDTWDDHPDGAFDDDESGDAAGEEE